MSTPHADHVSHPATRPHLSVDELLATRNTKPIGTIDELAADTFASDEELDEFLTFTHSERQRDLA